MTLYKDVTGRPIQVGDIITCGDQYDYKVLSIKGYIIDLHTIKLNSNFSGDYVNLKWTTVSRGLDWKPFKLRLP